MKQQPDSRTEVNEAIEQIEKRKKVLVYYCVENEMPDEVREVLDTEIGDLVNAANSLRYVLTEHYVSECLVCNEKVETEYPSLGIICRICMKSTNVKMEEAMKNDTNS